MRGCSRRARRSRSQLRPPGLPCELPDGGKWKLQSVCLPPLADEMSVLVASARPMYFKRPHWHTSKLSKRV
eukprot:5825309-Alexandrium_andersonii.AAC.1